MFYLPHLLLLDPGWGELLVNSLQFSLSWSLPCHLVPQKPPLPPLISVLAPCPPGSRSLPSAPCLAPSPCPRHHVWLPVPRGDFSRTWPPHSSASLLCAPWSRPVTESLLRRGSKPSCLSTALLPPCLLSFDLTFTAS